MKTKELIKLLQEADPSGEVEVCIGNADIHFVEILPAYYDGRLQVLQRNPDINAYNITGAKLFENGDKIVLHPLSIFDAIWNDPDLPIDYSDLSKESAERYKYAHDKTKFEAKELENKIELGYFIEFVAEKANKITDDLINLEEIARDFFVENLKTFDLFPFDLNTSGESYVSLRKSQWEKTINVDYDGERIYISFKVTNENSMHK